MQRLIWVRQLAGALLLGAVYVAQSAEVPRSEHPRPDAFRENWQTLNGELTRFQLCYGIHSSERALVWQRQGGFFLDGLKRDSDETLETLLGKFEIAAPTLPKMIRQTVGARLNEFAKVAGDVHVRRKEFRRAAWQKRLTSAARRTG